MMSVYFIRHGTHIKIGKSIDPWKRLASLQTAHYDVLEMLAIMPGNEELEYGLHRAFGQHITRGEWFEENDQLLAFIEMVKTTFPDSQRNLSQEARFASKIDTQGGEGEGDASAYDVETGWFIGTDNSKILELGESVTFRMTHKGHYRHPADSSFSFWDSQLFYLGGYWRSYQSEEWSVLYASGLRFEFVDMQHFLITRYGDIHTGERPRWTTVTHSLEGALNYALKEAVYNRRNNGQWLGVYNDDTYGIVIAIRHEPQEPVVQLDVPQEVIDYWRQYQYKSPLPDGVSIEA